MEFLWDINRVLTGYLWSFYETSLGICECLWILLVDSYGIVMVHFYGNL